MVRKGCVLRMFPANFRQLSRWKISVFDLVFEEMQVDFPVRYIGTAQVTK